MPRVRGQSVFEGRLIDWAIDRPVELPRLPVAWLSKQQKAAELQRIQAEKAARAAYEAELICGLADDTPDAADPPPDRHSSRHHGGHLAQRAASGRPRPEHEVGDGEPRCTPALRGRSGPTRQLARQAASGRGLRATLSGAPPGDWQAAAHGRASVSGRCG